MVKRLDFEALYSPDGRIPASEVYEQSWQVAESAKFYQKQVGEIALIPEQHTRRLAYKVQLGQDVQDHIDFIQFAESPQDEDYQRLLRFAKEGEEAKNQIVQAHLRLVAHIARLTMGWVPYGSSKYVDRELIDGYSQAEEKESLAAPKESIFKGNIAADLSIFKTAPLPLEDRIQAGTLGLARAAEKYQPDSPARFTTYAWWWIESKIIREIGEDRLIHIPLNQIELLNKARVVSDKLAQELGRAPTRQELREAVSHIPGTAYSDEVENADNILPFSQLDQRIYDRTDLSQDELVEQIMREEAVDKAMEKLPERERDVLAMRFGFVGGSEMTLEEVGSIVGVTRERVRQIENKGLMRLPTLRDFKDY